MLATLMTLMLAAAPHAAQPLHFQVKVGADTIANVLGVKQNPRGTPPQVEIVWKPAASISADPLLAWQRAVLDGKVTRKTVVVNQVDGGGELAVTNVYQSCLPRRMAPGSATAPARVLLDCPASAARR